MAAPTHLVEFKTEGFAPSVLQLYRVSGVEGISLPFRFELQLGHPEKEVPVVADILSKPAQLGIRVPAESGDGSTYHWIHGVVTRWEFQAVRSGMAVCTAVFESQLVRLNLFRKSRMYLKKDAAIDKVLQTVLKEELAADALEFQVSGAPATAERESTTQDCETNLDFIHRLAEHFGIFHHMKLQDQDWKKHFFSDDFSLMLKGPADIPYRPDAADGRSGSGADVPHHISSLVCQDHVIPDQVVLTDYDWRNTSPLTAKYPASAAGSRIVHLPRENFRTQSEGDYLAKIRYEALQAEQVLVTGESNVLDLRAGMKISVKNWFHPTIKELRILRVEHEFEQGFGAEGSTTGSYRNRFVASPADAPYRPPRVTPKPTPVPTYGFIDIGEGYSGLEAQGQYPVRDPNLLEQTEKGKGTATRLFRRIHANAGPKMSGDNRPLHNETEVLKLSLGDPDRWVIAGALYNSKFPDIVTGSNAQQSVRRTVGGNQEIIDDTENAQWVSWYCPAAETHLGLGTSHTASPTAAAGINGGTQQGITLCAGQTVCIASGAADASSGTSQAQSNASTFASVVSAITGAVAAAGAWALEFGATGKLLTAATAGDVVGLAAGIGGAFAHTNTYITSPTKVAVMGGGEVMLAAGGSIDIVSPMSATVLSGLGTLIGSGIGVSVVAAAKDVESVSLFGNARVEAKFRGHVNIEGFKDVVVIAKTRNYNMAAKKNVQMKNEGQHFQILSKENFLLQTDKWLTKYAVDVEGKKLLIQAGKTSSILMEDEQITICSKKIVLQSTPDGKPKGKATLKLAEDDDPVWWGFAETKLGLFAKTENAVGSDDKLVLHGTNKIVTTTSELDEKGCDKIARKNSEEG